MEAAKIMRRCDKDESGSIAREEFAEYYKKTAADMFRYLERHTVDGVHFHSSEYNGCNVN